MLTKTPWEHYIWPVYRNGETGRNQAKKDETGYFLIAKTLWRWPQSFSRTVAKPRCWILSPEKLNGGLFWLHSANEDAVSWLTSYGSWNAYEKKKETCWIFTFAYQWQNYGLFGNIFAPSNNLGAQTLCIKIFSAVTICQILFPIDKRYDKSKLSR